MEFRFVWDLEKELANVFKHGRTISEACEVFYDPDVVHLEDDRHSAMENRFYAVGKAKNGEILTVRYVWRGRVVRIFGAAHWRKWKKFYEKNSRSRKNETD